MTPGPVLSALTSATRMETNGAVETTSNGTCNGTAHKERVGNDPVEFEKLLHTFEVIKTCGNFNAMAAKAKPVFASKEKIICELLVEQEHVNGKGTLHGGMTASLTDILTARAVGIHTDKPMASIELATSYMLPVKIGEIVEITAIVLKVGLNVAFAEAEFRRKSDGKLASKGKHTIAILPTKPGQTLNQY